MVWNCGLAVLLLLQAPFLPRLLSETCCQVTETRGHCGPEQKFTDIAAFHTVACTNVGVSAMKWEIFVFKSFA